MFSYIFMHLGFLFYSFYTVLGKFAGKYEFLSLNFCIFYCILIGILFIYAILWQQILKRINLSIATANKAATIIWGMVWSVVFFHEKISLNKIIGAIIIICGIIILAKTTVNQNSRADQNEQ